MKTLRNSLIKMPSTSKCALFISDLHLSPTKPQVTLLFQHFLKHVAPRCDQLFILGDFFEYWLGEDVMTAFQQDILNQLKTLAEQGVALYFIHGNRDFLFSRSTLEQYYITLLKDPTLLLLFGKKVLLCHGDHLCTLDRPYQRYKKVARNPIIKWLFLHLRKSTRLSMAEKIHNKNPHLGKAQDHNYQLADTTQEAIQKDIVRYQPDLIIHGHTHRMGEHQHGNVKRIVLGDWHHSGSYIEMCDGQCVLQTFTL